MALVAVLILVTHLVWLALVIFGALWTRGRPVWSTLHILALLWGGRLVGHVILVTCVNALLLAVSRAGGE
jgi:hypothetical protein